MSFYGDPYGFGGYGPPGYYPAYPAQYYASGNTIYHHRRKPPKEKDNAQVWCDICDVGCIGQQSFIEHCSGRKHQLLERKKAQQQSTSPTSPSPVPRSEEPITSTTTTTNTTNITSNTTTSSNVRFSPYDPSAQSQRAHGKFYCELCKIYSNDQSTFQLHLAGKKHKINMQQLQPTVPDPYGPNLSQISSMHLIQQPRYHIGGTGRGGHVTSTLTNTPTNVEDDMLLTSKLASLTPSSADSLSLKTLVERVQAVLDGFQGTPSASPSSSPNFAVTAAPVVVETKIVGPYAWGTLLKLNLVADIVVITKDHPTFDILRYIQQILVENLPEVTVETGNDTMDMHIWTPQGYGAHLLFTWIGAWEGGDKAKGLQDYSASISPPPSPSPPSSPSSRPYGHSLSSPTSFKPSLPWKPPSVTTAVSSSATLPFSGMPVSPDKATDKGSVASSSSHSLHTDKPVIDSSSTSIFSTSTSTASSNPVTSVTLSPEASHASQVASSASHLTVLDSPSTMSTSSIPSTSLTVSSSTPTPTPVPSSSIGPQDNINLLASQRALLMIKQAMWFSHNSLSPNVRQCIKIMKDLRHRHTAFASLNNWALEVVVVNALRTLPLSASISQSLRAIFAFIASGTLLPGVDLLDPCIPYGSVLQDISQEDRLAITKAAQKILNDIAFGRWEVIVG